MRWSVYTGAASSVSKPTVGFANGVQEKVPLEQQAGLAGHALGTNVDLDLREVYFLIMHFLSTGPCKRTFGHLRDELLEHQLLPRRYHAWFSRSGEYSGNADDDGISFPLSYDNLVERYPHIEKGHLVKLLKQLIIHTSCPLHGKVRGNAPNAADVPTLLGSGSFSLLDGDANMESQQVKPVAAHLRWPHMHADQVRGLSLREIGGGFTKHHRAPSVRSACYAIAKPSTMVQKMQNIKKLRGHRNAVYCAIFDRSGRYVITGSDDRLVKIWSMETALCLASCRGHEGDITDLAVSSNNALVASASNDFVIRVWRLPDGMPISILRGHTATVTAIAFSPRPSSVYQLLSSSDDGTCRIWDARYSQCSPRVYVPTKSDVLTGKISGPFSNVASTSNTPQGHQILCCAYNANGTVFVTGSSDSNARVWGAFKSNADDAEQPIHELDVLSGHENDVNYVQFSGCSVAPRSTTSDTLKEDSVPKFKNSWFCHDNIVTCSRDGSAIIWTPRSRKSHGKFGRWTKAYHLKVPPPPLPPQPPRGGPRQRFLPTPRGVNMIVWSLDNRFVLAAIMDCRICVWNAADGSLVHCLTGHTASSYVLDVHPFNPRIAMSAGYDGRTIIWDIWEGTPIRIYEIGRFKLVDGKFSQDGTSIVLSDEVGQIYLLNTGQGESQKDAKYDQFFLGDYRPLIRDTVGNVLDQETQLAPHRRNLQDLLCDSSMIPYPEPYQTMYQRRRLGALGVEWHPSSIKFAVGPDFSLGEDYVMPPLEDMDRMIEPLPEFIDAMYWEPENEVMSDDTDSEYNAEECSSDGARASLCSSSSSDLECSSEDSNVEHSHKDSHHRPKRRKHLSVETATLSGRRVKKRILDEQDGSVSGSKRTKNPRSGRKASKRGASDKMTLRPQRAAARNARSMLSKISGSSTNEDDEDESGDSSNSETVRETFAKEHPLLLESEHVAKSTELPLSQGDRQRKKLILKIPAKKSLASVDSKKDLTNQADIVPVPSVLAGENYKEDNIGISFRDPGSASVNAINISFQSCDRPGYMNTRQTAKVDDHLDESAGACYGVTEENQTDGNRNGDKTGNEILHDLDGGRLESVPPPNVGSSPLVFDKDQSGLHESRHYDVFDGIHSSNKSKENPPKKLTKIRVKLKHPRSPLKVEPVEVADNVADGGADLVSEGPSSMDQIIGSGGRENGEASGSRVRMIENTFNAIDSRVSGFDFSEDATDAIRSTRSMKMRASSREDNARNSDFPVSRDYTSIRTVKKQETSSMRVYDKTLAEDWASSSRGVRSRSTRNRRDSYHANEPTSLSGKKLNNSLRKLSWLLLSEHEEGFRYIPQLGDEVVYFRQGHQEFIDSSGSTEKGPWRLLSGYLNAVEVCKVEKLDYGTSPGSGESCCKLTLRFVDPSSGVYSQGFKLTLPNLIGFPEFVVEKTRYDSAIKKNWGNKDKCLVWWSNDTGEGGTLWEGRIRSSQAKSDEFPNSPWERYTIQYKESGETHLHSPWELYDPRFSWENTGIDDAVRKKLLSAFAKLEQSVSINQDNYGIQKLNEAAQKMDFCNRFPVPIYPELIKLRLKNQYYRSIEAFKHDLDVMISNAETYFARNAQVLSKIEQMSDRFERLINKL